MAKLITIELDRERHLKYNLNAIITAEKVSGRSFGDLNKGKMDFDFMRALIYAGLLHEDETLTVDAVGDLIDFDNIEYVSEKLGEALQKVK